MDGINFDGLMNEEDLKDLREISITKRTIMSLFKEQFIIDKLTETVDGSECIDFYNDRSRKIPKFNISFTLKFIPEPCFKKYGIVSSDSSYDDKLDYMTNIVYTELIDSFITKLVNIVEENQEFLETLNKELCDLDIFKNDFNEDTSIKESLLEILSLSTLFTINISEDLSSATVQYFNG